MGKFFALLVNLSLVLVLCCGCAGKKIPASDSSMVNGKPYWYWQPSVDGTIGGVGEAGFHMNGPAAQRQLATNRAIEDIARQKGISVTQVQEITQSATRSGTSSTNIDTYSIYTVEGTVVSAIVREVWLDPDSGRIIVWATEIK